MDETDQQNELVTVPKCTDGDSSLKGSVDDDDDDDDDVKQPASRKNSRDASTSEILPEILSTNGTEKETNEGDIPKDVTETLGGEVQEETSPEQQLEKTSVELSEVSDDIENRLKEICEGVETIKENNSNVIPNDNSDLSKGSNCGEKNEEDCRSQIGTIVDQLNDTAGDTDQCNQQDLSENKESSCHVVENIKKTKIGSNIEKETNDSSEEQNSIKEIASILVDVEESEGQKESEQKADNLSLESKSHLEEKNEKNTNLLDSDFYKTGESVENSSESETNQSGDVQDKAEVVNNTENEDENLIQFSPLKSIDIQNNKSETETSIEVAEENKSPNTEEEEEDEEEKTDTLVHLTNADSNTCENDPQDETETTAPEFERGSVDTQNKSDSIEDLIESQVNVSNNSEEQEEENKSKGDNEGNELMDTEMVNCNEIDQTELNENESLKEKEIDRIQIEPVDGGSKGETRNPETVGDSLSGEDTEDIQEGQTDEILANEFSNNEPGSSAEEVATGYTSDAKDKDEDSCIIPDGGILKLADFQHISREIRKSKGESDIVKMGKVAIVEKPKTRAQDKKNEGGDASKLRPTRSAAKLAENKIKSLVANDMVFEEGTSVKEFEEDQTGEEEDEEEDDQENDEDGNECAQCGEVKASKLETFQNIGSYSFCSDACIAAFKIFHSDKEPIDSEKEPSTCGRRCSQCNADIVIRNHRRLFWETMDFCDEDCLAKFQHRLGSHCTNCKGLVGSTSIGKYCVRFGFSINQFCSGVCLEEYKKGLKVCSYCQKDISTGVEGFLAPVGSKNKFKDFCSQSCMEKYELMSSSTPLFEIIEECAVCSNKKPVQVQVELDEKTHKLCSEPCFAAFKFVNNITEGQCELCRKYYDCSKTPKHVVRLNFYEESFHSFCSRTCLNVYILSNRTIVPCNWCKIKKYDFDMIKQINNIGQLIVMCSITCLMSYRMSIKPYYLNRVRCGFCIKNRKPLYYLRMTDSSTRYFCNSTCAMAFQNCYKKKRMDMGRGSKSVPRPIGGPKRVVHPKLSQTESTCIPIISSVQSLASSSPVVPTPKVSTPRPDVNTANQSTQASQQLAISPPVSSMSHPPPPPPLIRQQIIVKPPKTKEMKNKSVLCKPYSHTKGVSCRPHPCMKETQTDQSLNRKFLIPIPVPIYVPAPMHMFATPFPVPVPFPLPIPVPIFIPTTRNSAKGIMKEIKKIQEKIPTDPFEAELLMMAEMVAGDKKQDPTDSESEDGNEQEEKADGTFYPENVDTSNTFGDDMLQMALKMASELEEPAVDMESVLTSSTITTNTQPPVDPNKALYASDDSDQVNVMGMNRGRKRSVRGSRNSAGGTPSKRGRRTSGSVDVPLLPPPEPVPSRTIEVEKPDANMCLKYTFGVNAWRHWVMQKNAELEKAALTNRKIKLFKPDLLQLTADELNFSLCLFVKEVRKPNGTEYAPDTIYYLCLGIQQYLFENGRIDNIFTDSYYEKFTDCLDEVAKKFAALYNDSQYIVTRVEEEHLWESKQLGAHSPHVLLSTLMFFNTKHFNLVTVEEHMQLSFSHIMKHWKRNPNTPGVAKAPGSRNVLLRFYPPQSALEANSRKKKVYEQQENEENPLRCPVKLYEFYLSKCPESVKTRNDVFYLLPERSCVPDSPVWYSTMALGKEPLMKMLHRVKMVKEINIALLTS